MAWWLFDRSNLYTGHYAPLTSGEASEWADTRKCLSLSEEDVAAVKCSLPTSPQEEFTLRPSSPHEEFTLRPSSSQEEFTFRDEMAAMKPKRRWFSEAAHRMSPKEPETPGQSPKRHQSREAIEYGAIVRTRLEKLAHRSRFVIDPRTPTMVTWNAVILFNMGLMMIISPLDNAFGTEDTTYSHPSFIFILDESIDAVFFIDTLLQFFLMYENKESDWVFDHSSIVCHYLKTWFCVDFVSVAPWDAICFLLQAQGVKGTKVVEALGMLRMCRFLKVLRVARVGRMIGRFQHKFGISYQVMILSKSIAMLLMMVHWLACLWCWIGRQDPIDDFGESTALTWLRLVKATKGGTDEQYDDPVIQYVVSVYWAVMTLTGVGYGDIVPGNTSEFAACCTCVLIAATFWAYITANLIGVVALVDQHQVRFQTTMDDLNEMMEERSLPFDLRQRLRQYFAKCRQFAPQSSYIELLDEMSPGLMGEVSSQTNREWLSKIWWLVKINNRTSYDPQSAGFVREISHRLANKIFPPREHLCQSTPSLYFLSRGLVTRNCCMLSKGSVWGEDLILDEPTLRQTETALALTYISVYTMNKLSLAGAMMKYPDAKDTIRSSAIRLAVIRGVKKYSLEVKGARHESKRPSDGRSGPRRASLLMTAVGSTPKHNESAASSKMTRKARRVASDISEFRLWGHAARSEKKEVDEQDRLAELRQPALAVKRHMDDLLHLVDNKMRVFDHRLAGIEGMLRMQKHAGRF